MTILTVTEDCGVRTVQPLSSLTTVWRSRAGVLLSAVLVLAALIFVYARTAGAHTQLAGVIWSESTSSTGFLLAVCTVETFLAWRVWRGGSVAWYFLVYFVGLSAGKTLVAVASSFGLYGLGLLVLLLIQFTLLISPAIRARRRRTPVASAQWLPGPNEKPLPC